LSPDRVVGLGETAADNHRGGMTRAKDAVGAYGERVAARTLADAGMQVLDRNWRCTTGELDIIARDGDTIVFCEVKTRRGERFGAPAEAVGHAKIRRLRALATMWLAAHPGCRGPDGWGGIRFDVVSVWPRPAGPAEVDHVRGAF
jgi:putative endonuclease